MKATIFQGENDVTVEEVKKPEIEDSEDALIRVTHTCVCGSDLWHYRGYSDLVSGSSIGHEPAGVVEEVGDDVTSLEPGDTVLAPFSISCGECEFCRKGLYTSCKNGDSWDGSNGGAQGEYVKCPTADGTLVKVPEEYTNDEMMEKLLPLTDVMCTGHHAAVSAKVSSGDTCIVIGDGAVGLCAVLAAQRLGAERIIAMGHHEDRLEIAEDLGATHTISERGEAAVEKALEITDGGSNHVLECVGGESSMNMAAEVARPGGTVGYVGVPYGLGEEFNLFEYFGDNIELRGGVAPVRKYIDELMEDVLQGNLDPSPVFTKEVSLENIDEGYEAMDDRNAVKVLVRPHT
ncbi:MAG: threonine dehydrogenase related Zn-dependent dehydrogenase [Candidatus Nanosalina sp. J07AB43]|nr:MAG: threonine dehydrogenase related Zn-dependent dehydrogenase [Candidatus Nanosalina sp. J07AB43]